MEAKLTDRLLLVGPPGSGKLAWARAFRDALPVKQVAPFEADMSYVYRVAGLAGLRDNRDPYPVPTALKPPFRAPHYSCSEAAVSGQLEKWKWRPGEINLAHGGVLVLEEVVEFRLAVVEPVVRAAQMGFFVYANTENTLRVPTQFALIVTSNPCPCGYYGYDRISKAYGSACKCSVEQVKRYQARLDQWRAVCREVEYAEWQRDLSQTRKDAS